MDYVSDPPPHRLEDHRLLTGKGRFLEDLRVPNPAHAVVLRAPVAHARITHLDITEASASPGVLCIITGGDLDRLGCRPMPCPSAHPSSDGTPFNGRDRHLLAQATVRFVGDPIAFVVAQSKEQAIDALDLIDIDFEELPPVTDPAASTDTAVVWDHGDAAAVDSIFAGAAHVVSMHQRHDRVSASPMETRSAIGLYENGRYVLHSQTQGVHFVCHQVAETLGVAPSTIHVLTGDVGGAFGIKVTNYPEQSLVLVAAKLLGRPVRWVADRSESFLADAYGRGQVSDAALALDADGRILALKVSTVGDIGAYASAVGIGVLTKGFIKTLGHAYHIPALYCRTRAVYTNMAPTDAYRGAGKPEAQYLVERLLEKAGVETGLGPVEIRRRNLIPPSAMPYPAANGFTYDSAHFERALDTVLQAADWKSYSTRRDKSTAAGLIRGRGVGLYLHLTGGKPLERSEILLQPDGSVLLLTGAQAGGQGHETTFARLVARSLEIPVDRVQVVEGDSAKISQGGGTGGSSSLTIVGETVIRAADAFLDNARDLASEFLETAAADLDYSGGVFTVTGTDRTLSLIDLAARLPDAVEPVCGGTAVSDHDIQTVPHGAYVAEVEVDPDTGVVRVDRFAASDDIGRRLLPQIAAGQLHGGLAQAIGQALFERVVHDPDTGQLLTGSLMDYQLPRASDLPDFELTDIDMPTEINRLGMKGVGENGTIGGIAPVVNAVCDALGVIDIDMPMTPEKVWQALRDKAVDQASAD